MSAYAEHPGHTSSYGAVELKHAAHRFGFVALTISILIHFSIIGLYYLGEPVETGRRSPPGGPVSDKPPIVLTPWQSVPGIQERPRPANPLPNIGSVGVPVPMSDDRNTIEQTIATQEDIADLGDLPGTEGVSGRDGFELESVSEDLPPPIFVLVEKHPEVVKAVAPIYPALAIKAGLEGRVTVKIWVDRQGRNRRVEIVKSDYEIFNEAALEAARQYIFTPAYMNSGPVSVWVAVPFTFKLSSR